MIRRTLLLLLVITLVVVLSRAVEEHPTLQDPPPEVPGPVLSVVPDPHRRDGLATLDGTGFTPGGIVSLTLVDTLRSDHAETRTVVAGLPTYGRDGSQDPAVGHVAGGAIHVVVGDLCDAVLDVIARDEATHLWSNSVTVASACAPETPR